MRKMLAFCTAICLFAMSGCANNDVSGKGVISETHIQSNIEDYIKDKLTYTLREIRIIEEDNGSYTVVASVGTEYPMDDFAAYAEQLVNACNDVALEHNVNFSCINPTMYTGDSSWIGWSSSTLNLYDQNDYLICDVSLSTLKNEVEKYKAKDEKADSDTQYLSFHEAKSRIVQYLNSHNDTSKMYDSVEIEMSNGCIEFDIALQAYETFTFASVVNAATDVVGDIVEEYGIKDYRLWVYSPTDAKYTISWISYNLKTGILTDKSRDGKYNEMVNLSFMLYRYGYEDYKGSLSDFFNSKNSKESQ